MIIRSIFPNFPKLKEMISVKLVPNNLDWEILVRSAQGIVNLEQPRIFVESHACDAHWQKFYVEHYRVPVKATLSDEGFLMEFKDCFKGYVLTDPKIIQTSNIAATLTGLEQWLPVHPQHHSFVKKLGLPLRKDLRGQFTDDVEAAQWAITNLLPDCNQKMMSTQCIHRDYWVAQGQKLRDYLVYNRVFQIDLASNRKHLKERNLHYQVLQHIDPPGVQLGWHCVRDQEKEWIAEAAKRGIFSLCSTGSPNLTLHGAIPQRKSNYTQSYTDPLKVEIDRQKVYITFYLTDGDAIWAMQNLQSDNWLHPHRGEMPFGWGFLPSLWFMAPGILEYYYSTKKPGDYFVSPSSGAGYTYSHMLPNAALYLKDSWELMQHTGQICGNMVNWNTYEWWREVEDDAAIKREQELLAGAPGLVCGLGGSPFAHSYLSGRCPKVHSVFIANAGHDNSIDILNLVDEIPNRPLFFFIFVQINRGSYDAVWQDFLKLKKYPEIEIIPMNVFMHSLKKAVALGWILERLYNESLALRKRHLIEPGMNNFELASKMIRELHKIASSEQPKRLDCLNKGGWQELAAREPEAVAKDWERFLNHFDKGGLIRDDEETDALAYFAYYAIWALVRGAILSKGIYANNWKKCLADFEEEFAADISVVPYQKMWNIWEKWETASHNIDEIQNILSAIIEELPKLEAAIR